MKEAINVLIKKVGDQLKPVYDHESETVQAAWWLLEALTATSAAHLIAQNSIELTQQQDEILQAWIKARVIDHKPLQYIIGWVPFNEVKIKVEPPVLIPRPETEEWVMNLCSQLQKIAQKKLTILDVGCGSGAIAITLAKELPQATIYASDIADHAITLTKENCALNHIKNVQIIKSDLFTALPSDLKFDLIVSNPPYISSSEYKKLDKSVTDWEDKGALVAEHNGFAIIEALINKAPDYLQHNEDLLRAGIGQLYIEIGYRQANHAKELMQNALYDHVKVLKDLEGKDRVVSGRVKKDVVAKASGK